MEGGAYGVMSEAELCIRLARPESTRRLGQALWMRVGEKVEKSDLHWARGLLGPGGEEVLFAALSQSGCLDGRQTLMPRPLAELLCRIWGEPPAAQSKLVWTLPTGMSVSGIAPGGYAEALLGVIRQARGRLLLVAPYLESKGVGRIQDEVLAALSRGVAVTVLCQDAHTLGSWAADSLESLRREARGLAGRLEVLTVTAELAVLVHSKLTAADGEVAIVGSANLTGKALTQNLETGVVAGAAVAAEVERVVRAGLEQGLTARVFSTEG